MQQSIRKLILFIFIVFATTIDAAEEDYLSPLALVASTMGKTVYIAESTAKQVALFDVTSGKVTTVIPLPDRLSGLALAPDGTRLYVTGGTSQGEVYIVDVRAGKVTDVLPVGHSPIAPVISPDGNILFVCNQFNNNVEVIDLQSKKTLETIPVIREPVAAALTPDGKQLLVANLLPAGAADRAVVAADVSVINTITRRVTSSVQLPNGSIGLRDICISPDGKYAYVTHILARYQMPTTQLERGWMNTNALSIIDVKNQGLVNTVLLDNNDLGAANPWGVACSQDGTYLCVAHAGTHEVSVINRVGMHEKIEKITEGEYESTIFLSAADIPNDLSFLVGLRQRLKLKGKGPRGLAIVGMKVYVAEYFSNSIGIVDIDPESRSMAESIALGPNRPLTAVRRGEMFFYDATRCFQQWQSCSSCHPEEGRPDALNWDLLNDGMGNPKNTKSLLLTHSTPPAMISGARDEAETAVRSGIRFILLAKHPEEDAVSLDEYLKSLKPIPSPYLTNGQLSQAAERGKGIFEKAECASCHPPPLYTDLKKYDVGLGKDMEKEMKFDTTTLVEIWRTSPYLYDGRAVNMREVLTEYNSGDKHGVTSKLTEKEINDLVEFILSL